MELAFGPFGTNRVLAPQTRRLFGTNRFRRADRSNRHTESLSPASSDGSGEQAAGGFVLGDVVRAVASVVGDRPIGSALQQKPDQLVVSADGSRVQRDGAVSKAPVDISARVEQKPRERRRSYEDCGP